MDDEKPEHNFSVLEKLKEQRDQPFFNLEESLILEEVLKKRALESGRGQIHDRPRWAEK